MSCSAARASTSARRSCRSCRARAARPGPARCCSARGTRRTAAGPSRSGTRGGRRRTARRSPGSTSRRLRGPSRSPRRPGQRVRVVLRGRDPLVDGPGRRPPAHAEQDPVPRRGVAQRRRGGRGRRDDGSGGRRRDDGIRRGRRRDDGVRRGRRRHDPIGRRRRRCGRHLRRRRVGAPPVRVARPQPVPVARGGAQRRIDVARGRRRRDPGEPPARTATSGARSSSFVSAKRIGTQLTVAAVCETPVNVGAAGWCGGRRRSASVISSKLSPSPGAAPQAPRVNVTTQAVEGLPAIFRHRRRSRRNSVRAVIRGASPWLRGVVPRHVREDGGPTISQQSDRSSAC